MKNTLKWKNRNTLPFTINIYRGAAPLDRNNLTNPIATLTNGETQYEDEVVRGSTNYYVIETVKNGDKAPGNNLPITALPKRGPGPLTLKQGDYNYGYFGSLPSREFISTTAMLQQVAPSLAALTAQIMQVAPTWHKYVRKGKILYIPQGPLISNVPYTTIYNAGLVFGVDNNGPYLPAGGVATNQLKFVEFGGNKYKVRLMTGFNDDLSVRPTYGFAQAEYLNPAPNEWDDLVYPLCEYTPDAQRMANVMQGTRAILKLNIGTAYRFMVQEISSNAGAALYRGTQVEGRGCVGFIAGNDTNISPGSTYLSYWPVLELVES
jgi:hypothetical protein